MLSFFRKLACCAVKDLKNLTTEGVANACQKENSSGTLFPLLKSHRNRHANRLLLLFQFQRYKKKMILKLSTEKNIQRQKKDSALH